MNRNRRRVDPALLIVAVAAIALAFVVWSIVGAAPSIDPPECDPGVVCEPYPPPYPGPYPAPPVPDASFLPFVAEESYP